MQAYFNGVPLFGAAPTEEGMVPLKFATRAEFDALPETDKQGVLYIVDNGETSSRIGESSISALDLMPVGTFIISAEQNPPNGYIEPTGELINMANEDPATSPWLPYTDWLYKAFGESWTVAFGGNVDQNGMLGTPNLPMWEAIEKNGDFHVYFRIDPPATISGDCGDNSSSASRYQLYYNGELVSGSNGLSGVDGKSAYQIAVENGFEGTEEEWLQSLKGYGLLEGEVGVTPVTQSEYDATSEADRQDRLFLVTDSATPMPVTPKASIYSEDEIVVGTWIDGKPIYRKVFPFQTPSSSSVKVVADISGLNWDTIMGLQCYVEKHSTNKNFAFNCHPPYYIEYNNTQKDFFHAYINTNKLEVDIRSVNGYDCPAYFILEYTKTTDQPGSMSILPLNYVQDYDTEDGWHVRKHSDGYVEMSITKTYDSSQVTFQKVTGFDGRTANLSTTMAIPVPLLECYTNEALLFGSGNACVLTDASGSNVNPLGETRTVNIWSAIADNTNPHPYPFQIMFKVTGRWK